MSRGNGAEMSVAKKFPATWPWCYRPNKYSIQASECQALDKQHFEAKAAKLLEKLNHPENGGNGTQSALKMLRLCVT